MAQRLEKSLKKEINIYIALFAAPFGLKKGRNLQFICNANKVILARETE